MTVGTPHLTLTGLNLFLKASNAASSKDYGLGLFTFVIKLKRSKMQCKTTIYTAVL